MRMAFGVTSTSSSAAIHSMAVSSVWMRGAGNFTVKVDSGEGSEYTATLSTTDMTAVADARYAPDRWVFLRVKDHILLEWANAGAKTWGLEVIYKSAEA